MSKQDTIISLLKEIDKNIDNINDSGGADINLKELTITANGEYVPEEGIDGFSKVVANVVPTRKVVLYDNVRIPNSAIIDGYWAGELVSTDIMTSFVNMFFQCSSLQTLDVSSWNTSNVTNMKGMFDGCSSLQTLDISNWNTRNVTNIGAMFWRNLSLQILDVCNFETSNVTNTDVTFYQCFKLQSLIGNRTIDDVLANNIGALNGLKVELYLNHTILDRASIRAVINGLADLTGSDAQTLTLGKTLIAKLTEEDIAVATAKNWTIA